MVSSLAGPGGQDEPYYIVVNYSKLVRRAPMKSEIGPTWGNSESEESEERIGSLDFPQHSR
jgi:hypothetical protein